MRSGSDTRVPTTPRPGAFAARLVAVFALVVAVVAPPAARAELHTFQLTVGDALASVDKYNAYLVSLGKHVHGVKLIPGGTTFARQSCAGFGSVFQLGSVTILSSPSVLTSMPALVGSNGTSKGKVPKALATVFTTAGVQAWTVQGTAETNLRSWSVVPADGRVQFAADAITKGTGDDGLLGPEYGDGILRFSVDPNGFPDQFGRYRLLLELYGRTSSRDGALVKAGDRRCFTFVDLMPVDFNAFNQLAHATVLNGRLLRSILEPRFDVVWTDLTQDNLVDAIDKLTIIAGAIVSHAPELIDVSTARFLADATYRVRSGLLFSPVSAVCGNGIRETGEACDGSDLGGFTCTTAGFGPGTLACTADCRLDTSQCGGPPVCGNGIVEGTEECDDGAANSDTKPDACRTNCKRAYCGDGVIDSYEDCEGNKLNGETCVSLGYSSGTLHCDPEDCIFDDSHCND